MAGLWLFLAALLAISAGHKLAARERLTVATARLAGAPLALGPALLFAAASAEALAAIALLVAPLRSAGALTATAIWMVYALALFARRGQVLDCGCDFVRRERPVGLAAILRPALLAFIALAVAAMPPAALTADAPFAALALLALTFAASELAAIPANRRKPA
jgi:hypothetical protein